MNDIENQVIKCIADQSGHDPEQLKPSDTLYSLDLDQIDRIELVMMIEDEFNIVIDDRDAEKWKSVQSVIDYMEKLKP